MADRRVGVETEKKREGKEGTYPAKRSRITPGSSSWPSRVPSNSTARPPDGVLTRRSSCPVEAERAGKKDLKVLRESLESCGK
jgi:hypothetical protein